MKGVSLKNLEDKESIIIDQNEEFTFMKCMSADNCIEYIKKGSELTEIEIALVKDEYRYNSYYK